MFNCEEILRTQFDFSEETVEKLLATKELYEDWNAKINVISRKDMDNFYEHHLIHSLSIALFSKFEAGTSFIDVGTGGGFPGIPLAIMYPECTFLLNDSIGKKLKVAQGVADALGLKNVKTQHARSEDIKQKFDVVLGRAVKNIPEFYGFTKHLLTKDGQYWYLKGGDFQDELVQVPLHSKEFSIYSKIKTEFYETKKVVNMWP